MLLKDLEQEELDKEDYEESAANWLTGNRKIVSLKTTARRLTSVRGFAKFARWGAVLEDYKAPYTGGGEPHPIPEGMDGIRRMIAQARNQRQAAMVALCGFLGCRISEALSIRVSDFNLNTMVLHIQGKGEKVRYVPISDEAWMHLAAPVMMAMMTGTNAEIVGIKERVARSNVTAMAQRAKLIRHVASHDLRATFATAVFDKTKDPMVVKELLGHASVETTQLYIETNMNKLRTAVNLNTL